MESIFNIVIGGTDWTALKKLFQNFENINFFQITSQKLSEVIFFRSLSDASDYFTLWKWL